MDAESHHQGTVWVDDEVVKCLPEGASIVHACPCGVSEWTKTSKISAELPGGTLKDYFLKTSSEPVVPVMMRGEFTSISTIRALMPDFIPTPHGWGECKSSPGTYFVLMDFLDLDLKLPDPAGFTRLVSDLHKRGKSPTGMFGFHVSTCHGKIPQPNTWDPRWCQYFARLITIFYDWDMEANGPWTEYEEAFAILKAQVIPRLLEPLQADGRVLTPSLVHGDLWEANVGTNVKTGEPVVYDPSVSYAHHEYELGMWRREIIAFDQPYVEQYLACNPASEPAEDWDDRNRLYSIKFNISHSAHWKGETNCTRPIILDDMKYLIDKYAS